MLEFYLPLLTILLLLTLALYLLLRRRGGVAVYALSAALLCCAGSELFDLLAMANPEEWLSLKRGTLIAESLQPFCFLLFALTFARAGGIPAVSRFSKSLLAAALILPLLVLTNPPVAFFRSPDFGDEHLLFLTRYGFYFYIALMAGLAAALFHLERTMVALNRPERSRVKLELVGAGLMMVVLAIYYSQSLFYRSLDMGLVPVRSLVLAIGTLLIGFSRLRGTVVAGVRVSRDMAFRSLVLLAVSLYLVGLGLLGEGMRYLDVSLQRALFFSVAILSGLAVVMVLLSEKLRRRVKVFLSKHFYRQKYDYREEWRRFTGHLSAAHTVEELQQGILSFFCDTFACGLAGLYLRGEGENRYNFACGYQIGALELSIPGGSPFVSFLTERDWVFNVADENPPELKQMLAFCREHEFTLAVPLLFENSLEGVIFLGRPANPDEDLIYEDFDLMKMLARQATSTLFSLRLSAQLNSAREMAAMGRVSTFVVHDLKNLVSNLAMVTDNAAEYLDDPDFQRDMLETLHGTVARMKELIARLRNVAGPRALNLTPNDLRQMAENSCKLAGCEPVMLSGESVYALVDGNEIQKVLQNLLINAREASPPEAPIWVEVGCGDVPYVRVRDNGKGMEEEFIRQRLFQPFQTTKAAGFGIGLYQCRSIVEAHGGRIEVESRPGAGSCFTVWLPGDSCVPGAEGD